MSEDNFTQDEMDILMSNYPSIATLKYKDYFRILKKVSKMFGKSPMTQKELNLMNKNGVEILMSGDIKTVEDCMIFMAKGLNNE